jgi:hypothetical protein
MTNVDKIREKATCDMVDNFVKDALRQDIDALAFIDCLLHTVCWTYMQRGLGNKDALEKYVFEWVSNYRH